jgi:hypothetical protein
VHDLVARTSVGERWLSNLTLPGESMRAAFDLSYRALSSPQRRLFRLLGRCADQDITVDSAASLAGHPPNEARTLLDALLDHHLLQEPEPGRYRMHDVLHQYAMERAHGEEIE